MRQWFRTAILARRWATFVVMGLAFLVFGCGTLNLFLMLNANATLLATYGWQAVMDGGARQLAELLVSGYAGLAAYIVFKACEHALVHHLTDAARGARSERVDGDSDDRIR